MKLSNDCKLLKLDAVGCKNITIGVKKVWPKLNSTGEMYEEDYEHKDERKLAVKRYE